MNTNKQINQNYSNQTKREEHAKRVKDRSQKGTDSLSEENRIRVGGKNGLGRWEDGVRGVGRGSRRRPDRQDPVATQEERTQCTKRRRNDLRQSPSPSPSGSLERTERDVSEVEGRESNWVCSMKVRTHNV